MLNTSAGAFSFCHTLYILYYIQIANAFLNVDGAILILLIYTEI